MKTIVITLFVFIMGLSLSKMKCISYLFILYTTILERNYFQLSGKQTVCVSTVIL